MEDADNNNQAAKTKETWSEITPLPQRPMAEFKYFAAAFSIPGYLMAAGAAVSLVFLEFGAFFGLAIFAAVFIAAGKFLKKFFIDGNNQQIARLVGSDKNGDRIEKIISVKRELDDAEILNAENNFNAHPWTRREDWVKGEISEIGAYGPLIWIIFIVVLNALCFGIPFGFYLENPESPDWIVIIVSSGMAIAGNVVLIKRSIHEIRYGVSKLILSNVPVEPGNYLQATLKTGVRATRFNNKSFEVSLVCANSSTSQYKVAGSTASDQKTRTQKAAYAVWSETKTFPGVRGSNGKYELKLVFKVPDNQPTTQPESTIGRHYWLIRVEAKMTGINYNAEFEVPVFEKTEV